jgi:hypothetical protein
MRIAAFTYVAAGFLLAGPAYAACSKPDIPACAVQGGAFPTAADYDRCRKQMLVYKSEMESHSSCARQAGQPQEGQTSEQELQATLATFNRRARGE